MEIEVIGEGAIEVEAAGLEEVVNTVKDASAGSDESALALLADITSKYQQGDSTLEVVKKEGLEEVHSVYIKTYMFQLFLFWYSKYWTCVGCQQEVVYQEETVAASKMLENVEVVEVQISQVDNLFRCSKCDRGFKLYYHLKQHLKTHVGSLEKPHVCSHCGKAYTREGALKQHISTFHFDAEELSRNQKPQKKLHVCEFCKKHFDHFGHFKEHLRKHTGKKKSIRLCSAF